MWHVKGRGQICTRFVHKLRNGQNLEELGVNGRNINMDFQELNERVNLIYLVLDGVKCSML